MGYQHCGMCMTIFPVLQKKKLGTNMSNLSKVTQIVSGLPRVRTRDLTPKCMVSNATWVQQWDLETYGNLFTLSGWVYLGQDCLFLSVVRIFAFWFQSIICFNLLLNILNPNCNVWGFSLHLQGSSPAPAGCPTVQLNSDTVYPEVASAPTG